MPSKVSGVLFGEGLWLCGASRGYHRGRCYFLSGLPQSGHISYGVSLLNPSVLTHRHVMLYQKAATGNRSR